MFLEQSAVGKACFRMTSLERISVQNVLANQFEAEMVSFLLLHPHLFRFALLKPKGKKMERWLISVFFAIAVGEEN